MNQLLPQIVTQLAQPPHIATVGTIQPDGSPQLSPVWITHDGTVLRFSTITGRRKHANIIRDNRISVSITDTHDPMRRVEVRGHAEILDDPQRTLIEQLSLSYTGKQWIEAAPDAHRVIIQVTPQRIITRP